MRVSTHIQSQWSFIHSQNSILSDRGLCKHTNAFDTMVRKEAHTTPAHIAEGPSEKLTV